MGVGSGGGGGGRAVQMVLDTESANVQGDSQPHYKVIN
jgi:hypothetical protein